MARVRVCVPTDNQKPPLQALQAACQRLATYVQALEEKFDAAERKRK